jgi:hypothetical protein
VLNSTERSSTLRKGLFFIVFSLRPSLGVDQVAQPVPH